MHSYSEFEGVVGPVTDLEGLCGGEQLEGHGGDVAGVVVGAVGEAGHHHVRVADRLHLVDVEELDDLVELGVQLVQEIDHLKNEIIFF